MYYDEGWNARIRGESFKQTRGSAWKQGWKDCDELSEKERKEIGEI